jgi:UDP-N-acetylmuramate dehydrogenase
VIFADEGFRGLVIRIEMKGVEFLDDGDSVLVACAAGENWDELVQQCIARGLAGIECLSGIPGSVGATPIQNVGAYGQEVRETIVEVGTIDRQSLDAVTFSNADCRFGYRQSRFKSDEANRYVITGVAFRLRKNGEPTIRYPELQKFIGSSTDLQRFPPGRPQLDAVRAAVVTLRKRKSMVIDPNDPNSRSVGSFFMNPVLPEDDFNIVKTRWHESGRSEPIPTFPTENGIKVPAAWLVEKAGFKKGYRTGGVGVSDNHSLALVNRGGTAKELLDLARAIQEAVHARFGIHLEREPIVVPP